MTSTVEHRRPPRLPALRVDSAGRRHVDLRAVTLLALPLMLNSAVQMVLNLTDTWFIGRLSTEAMAAMGAVHFLAIMFMILLGGVGLAVQTLVAQAYGGRRSVRAAHGTWLGLWGAGFTAPLFLALAASGTWLLYPFDLAKTVEANAVAYWTPRMIGGPLAVALWAVSGFFNGIGRTRVTLFVMVCVALLNALLNALLIFGLGLGIAGAAWATTMSLGAGAALATGLFLSRPLQHPYRTRLAWRPSWRGVRRIFALGIPTGMFPAVDITAISLFQLMQVKLGPIEGAATQIVMMLTSIAYLPAIGIAIAGTTLVGQSIGAGDKAWAARLGNATMALAMVYMGTVGVGIAIGGPWLVPLFTDPAQESAAEVIALGVSLVWIAGAYQLFDAMNLGAAFCLRGAGDVRVPTLYLVALAWGGFVPLAHVMSFAPGQGWVAFLPQLGWGAAGGWLASLLYIVALGVMMWLRWRSGAWQRLKLT
jgi:MATE family multidrug resistance protein